MKRVVAFIFARGGSKGVPGKNIRNLGDKPLIAHAIETAQQTDLVESVIVSTDDGAIADVARQYGAEVPFNRPIELSTDHAPEWAAWQHAIQWFTENRGSFDTFLSLPATSPFRSTEDVSKCLETIHRNEDVDVVLTGAPASRSPYFNMVELDENGLAHLAASGDRVAHRQLAPVLYDLTTVAYVARPEFVLRASHIFDGRVGFVEVPAERALDIDTELDFQIAEFLWQRNHKFAETNDL